MPHHDEKPSKQVGKTNPINENEEELQSHDEHEEILHEVGNTLHTVADSYTALHGAGIHLHGPKKYIGPLAAGIADIIHNPSSDVVEKVVCGTATAVVREATNTAIASRVAIPAGTAAGFAGGPAVGVAVAASTGIAAYKIANPISAFLANKTEQVCHAGFEWLRSLPSSTKEPDDTTQCPNSLKTDYHSWLDNISFSTTAYADDLREENSFCTFKRELTRDYSAVLPATAVSFTKEASYINHAIVSHTTGKANHVQSILADGISLKSHPKNLFGGKVFYVAESGYSFHETLGEYRTIAFRVSPQPKIFDIRNSSVYTSGADIAFLAKNVGYDAIQYESLNSINGKNYYNLAVINNSKNLTPVGIYPVPEYRLSAISLPTIRGLQALGAVGTLYGLTHAGLEIINSDYPIKESIHQVSLLSAATLGGALAGTKAIGPCSALGALFPPAAPVIIPSCIFGASVLGGMAGAFAVETAWQGGNTYFCSKNENLSQKLTSEPIRDDNMYFNASKTEQTDKPSLMIPSLVTEEPQTLSSSETISTPLHDATVSPEIVFTELSEEQAHAYEETLRQDVKILVKSWADEAKNISGFERCDHIAALAQEIERLEQNQAPEHLILQKTYELKQAKSKEQTLRVNVDEKFETAQGLAKIAGCISWVAGNPRLASQVIQGSQSVITIGQQLAALAGYGSLAANINPLVAAGTIGLAAINLFSLFNKNKSNDTQVILESLNQLKEIVENLRKEMHERFDLIDEKLETLHQDIILRIDQLQLQGKETQLLIQEARQENKQAHRLTHDHLESVQVKINGLYNTLREQQVNQALHAITDAIGCSLNHISVRPTPEQYEAWLAQFQLFFEQSAYSAILTGNRNQKAIDASQWQLANKPASEGDFHVNALLGYFEQFLPDLNNLPNQPNMLLWAYPSLAIIRLILMLNNQDQGLIRRNEFNILDLIKQKAQSIEQFYQALKQPAIATQLIADYQSALHKVGYEIQQFLTQVNEEKNKSLHDHLLIQLQTQWALESQALANQEIPIYLNYSNWFTGWTDTHYGTREYNGRLTEQHKANYQAARQYCLTTLKRQHTMPAYAKQKGLEISANEKNSALKIEVQSFSAIALYPENPNDPVLNLWGEMGLRIDLAKLLQVPSICFEAQYLGLAQLSYRYQVNTDTKKMKISACLSMNQHLYPICSLECFFDVGPYYRKDGITWGWFGKTNVTIQQVGPVRWIGSTGEDKHWFLDYAVIPTFSCPDLGPLESLANPQANNARPITSLYEAQHRQNLELITQAVEKKLEALLVDYEATLKTQALTPGNPLSAALDALEAAYQRIHAYTMLALPDCYDDHHEALTFLFDKQSNYTRSIILDSLSQRTSIVSAETTNDDNQFKPNWSNSAGYNQPQFYKTIRNEVLTVHGVKYLVAMIRNCANFEVHLYNPVTQSWQGVTGPNWSDGGGYHYPKYYETIRTEIISIHGVEHLVAMIRNCANFEVHLYNPTTQNWQAINGPKWFDSAGYNQPQFYETIRTDVISINGIEHLAAMIRNCAIFEVHLYNPITQSWQTINGPSWPDLDGYNLPQYYKTIRTDVISINGIEHLAVMIRNCAIFEVHLYNPITQSWQAINGPSWPDLDGYNLPQYYETIRTDVISINGIEHLAVMIRNCAIFAVQLYNPVTQSWQAINGPAWSDKKDYHQDYYYYTLRTAVINCNNQQQLITLIRNNQTIELETYDPISASWLLTQQAIANKTNFLIQSSTFDLPIKLKNLATELNQLLSQPLHQLLITQQGKTNNNLFDKIYEQVVSTYDFYKDRIDEKGTYQDLFEESEATKQQFEAVNTLLQMLTTAVNDEVLDPSLRLKIVANMQEQMRQKENALPANNTKTPFQFPLFTTANVKTITATPTVTNHYNQ